MNSTKIIFFGARPEEKNHLNSVSGKLQNLEIIYQENAISPESLPEQSDCEAIAVFVDSIINQEVLDQFPNLKFIAVRSTGYDNIDLSETSKRNILVSNVPSYGENTVAEFAFGLILALSRKIYLAADQVKETGSFDVSNLRGFDLLNKTIGVIGTGRIGKYSMKIAKGFGMNIVAYDPYPNEKMKEEIGFEYMTLEQVLEKSDVVTLHVPYSKETHHLINEKTLSLMKPSAILVNTSRGGIIDTDALVKTLMTKKIAGAGLDVIEEEGIIKNEAAFLQSGSGEKHDLKTVLADHALVKMPNVLVTPHNAFNTDEAVGRIIETTIDNILAFRSGSPKNLVKA